MKSFTAITSLLIASAAAAPITETTSKIQRRAVVATIGYTTASTYFGATGEVQYGVNSGHIFRDGVQSDQSTLVTFDIPQAYAGLDCTFQLSLDGPDDYASGSKEFNIFTAIKPATASAASWPSGNLRDQDGGRMKFVGADAYGNAKGDAVYVEDIPHPAKSFKCPTGIVGGELVPAGQKVDIYWSADMSTGPKLIVSNPAY
jgi:hypothetical protein